MAVRIGFVGVGSMGQCAHLKNYVITPDCEVVALAEIRPELACKVAARYGVPRVYPTHGELLAGEKLDGIVAAQPFTRHGTLIPELLKAGVPVFTEKPIAAAVEMGEKIVRAMKKARTWMMIGYHKRSDPATMFAVKEIRRLKESGELGAMRYVRITMPPGDWIAGGFADLIRTDEKYPPLDEDPAPRGMDEATRKKYITFVNYYIHQVNLMRHLFGEDYKVVFAEKSGVLFVARSRSGIAGTIEMAPYNTSIDWQEAALVGFERGYVRIDLPAPLAANRPGTVTIFKDLGKGTSPQTVIPQLPWVGAMRQQAANFVAALRGRMEPLCTAEEALEDLKVARDYIRLAGKSH